MKKIQHPQLQKGFTLVELMVSLSLFIVIVIALIGSLYTVNDASRKVQAMRTVMDNLNFAVESISRTVRTSEHISCGAGGDCWFPIGGDSISMDSTLGEHRKVEYRWVIVNGKGVIQKKSTGILDDGSLDLTDVIDWEAITAPEIDIDTVKFYVSGTSLSDQQQPRVVVTIDGVATVQGGTTIPFSIQTYLSQRTPE